MRRTIATTTLVCALLFTLAWSEAAPQQPKARNARAAAARTAVYGNSDAITQDELKLYTYFMASDQMEGRNSPSRGYDTAALYIASNLNSWGVRPGGNTTGTGGPLQPYLMPFELVSNQLDSAGMKLTLTMPPPGARGGRGEAAGGRGGGASAPTGPVSFEYGKQWTVGGGGGRGGGVSEPVDIAGAQLVFAGHGYVIHKTNTNPYQGIDVRGKIVVVAGVPPELAAARAQAGAGRGAAAGGAGRGGGGAANPLGTENVDFMTPQGYAAKNGALGIITVPTFQQLSAMASPPTGGRGPSLNGPSYQVVRFQANRPPSVPAMTAGLELITSIFQGERMSAAQVFEGAAANVRLDSFELNAQKKLDLHIAVASQRSHAFNVIAMLEGSDPVLKNEYVVISAHLDHSGLTNPVNGDGILNGADDDVSGCAAIMAMARAWQEGAAKGIRPKRTIIYLWVAGEEKGLWGSQYFCQFPPVDITKVVLDINMDMIGRSKTPGYVDPPQYKLVEPGEIFIVGPNISSDEVDKALVGLNDNYMKLKLNHFYDVTAPDETHDNLGPQPNGQRIFYRSDHYNFAKMGIPVAFFTSGLHSDYHRPGDSPEKIDYEQMHRVAKTVSALAWVVGNQTVPPRLKENLPERLINDMKTVKEQGWGKLTPIMSLAPGIQ